MSKEEQEMEQEMKRLALVDDNADDGLAPSTIPRWGIPDPSP